MSIPADTVDLTDFPSTRYQGSKRKILPWIYEHLRNLEFHTALDAFGGTGSVSYLMKKMGKAVTYNDYLHFNYLIGLAIIENNEVTLSNDEIADILGGESPSGERFIQKTFRNIYYKNRENTWLDRTVTRISNMNSETKSGKYKQAVAYYSLFQSALVKRPFNLFHRRNLYIREANVSRQFGNKRTWDRSFSYYFRHFVAETNDLVFKGANKCNAKNHNALELAGEYDLVYLDPPYLTRNSANETADYRRCYHFLEGLSRYDLWEQEIDYETPNLRFRSTHPNPWIDPQRNKEALDILVDNFPQSIIVISYKRFGHPSIEGLKDILKRHGRETEMHSRRYSYALNHQNGQALRNREVLIISHPRAVKRGVSYKGTQNG